RRSPGTAASARTAPPPQSAAAKLPQPKLPARPPSRKSEPALPAARSVAPPAAPPSAPPASRQVAAAAVAPRRGARPVRDAPETTPSAALEAPADYPTLLK